MINLDRFEFEVECPKCRFATKIFYRDARLRDVLICRGCKANIQLDDHMNECQKARRQVNTAVQEIEDALARLNTTIKHTVEWFEREELTQLAGDERKLAKHLYAFLFGQGLDFHIEPQSASGEADLVSPDLVLDAKVFDGSRRGVQYLASGVHQVHTYARDFDQEVGYLVVYKTCPETIDFTFSSAGQHAPYVTVGGKTIYIFVIDICEYPVSASKRGAMKVHAVEQDFLVRAAESAASTDESTPTI